MLVMLHGGVCCDVSAGKGLVFIEVWKIGSVAGIRRGNGRTCGARTSLM